MRVDNSIDAEGVSTGAAQGAGSVGIIFNSWLLLAAGFVAIAYAL